MVGVASGLQPSTATGSSLPAFNKPLCGVPFSCRTTTSQPSSLAHNERIRQYALVYCSNGGLSCREPLPSPMILPLSRRDAELSETELGTLASVRKPWSKLPAMLAGRSSSRLSNA